MSEDIKAGDLLTFRDEQIVFVSESYLNLLANHQGVSTQRQDLLPNEQKETV